jgi:hypothetical protein
MKYLKSFYESNHEDSVVIYDEAIKKFLPEKFRIYTSNGEFSMKKDTITREIDILRICYEHNTMEEFGGNALADGEPDTLEFDMHFVKEDNKLKILIDITYGDSMVSEFSVKQPNKLDVIHYNGIGSKADPETHFGLCDDSIKDLTKFINAFGFKFQTKDFSFIDKYPETYVAEDVKLAPLSGDQKVMVVNNAKPQENRFLHNILRYLKMRGIEYVVATNPEDVSRINSNDNIIGAILSGSDYRFTKPLDESEPLVSKKALEILKCPILGLCYGMQSMVVFHGGEVELLLATKNTSVLAKNFLKSKYIVIIEDVVIKKSRLDLYLKELKSAKVKIILLLPSKNTLKHRDGLRSKEFQLGKRALDLHDMFTERLNKEKRWSVLDTSNETVLMTTKRICDLLKIK